MKSFVAYLGHHKCGSNAIARIMRRTANQLGMSFERLNLARDFDGDLIGHLDKMEPDCLCWVNADYALLPRTEFRAFHVVRDPRDILVSAYFSHLESHPAEGWPELAELRPELKRVSKEEGLSLEFRFHIVEDVFRRLREWDLEDPRILTIRLEDMVADYGGKIREAFEFLGLFERGLDDKRLERTLDEYRFEKLSGGRRPGEEDPGHHYRMGVPGDWRNHLDEAHVSVFKSEFNDVLVKYGYERDTAWSV